MNHPVNDVNHPVPNPTASPAGAAAAPRPDEAAPVCGQFHAHPSKIARIRRCLIDQHAGAALADTFKVLGDVTRVRLLDALAQAELCVCDLAALVGLSESAVSHQLRLLRSMRVVRARREGRMVYYALDDEHVMALFDQGLRHIEEGDPASGRTGGAAGRPTGDGHQATGTRRPAAPRGAR